MKNIKFSTVLPYIVAILLFLIIAFAYYSPSLEGKVLRQGDNIQFRGMVKEIVDYRSEYENEPLWTNSMFSGMPAYLISTIYTTNLIKYVDRVISLSLHPPVKYLFLTLIGFYLLLVVGFRVDPWLAIAGSIGFSFSSYFFIIETAGHNTKAHALAYMPFVLTGVVMSFRGKLAWGAVLTALFLALQIIANHPQITYYTLLIVLLFGLAYLIEAFKEKMLPSFFKTVGVLIIAVILAVGVNITSLLLISEYGKVSIRGKSELSNEQGNKTSGLDKDYILNDYSYGIDETMNLFIPNFKGGPSGGFDLDSKTYDELKRSNVQGAKQIVQFSPLAYWGTQRFTAGPVYIGAVVIFLFVLGLFVVKGPNKWWLASAVILSIMLAWGKNFMFLSDLFINYFPGYNKFRTVSMTLVIAEFAMPLLGILALKEIFDGKIKKEQLIKSLKYTLYIVGGVALFFSMFPGMLLDFVGPVDEQLKAMGWPDQFILTVHEDRKDLLQSDAIRSLIFVLLTGGLLIGLIFGKIKQLYFILGLGVLFLADLWPVNKRYINNDNFVRKIEVKEPFKASSADLAILQDKNLSYRVLNLSVDTYNDASTSWFHKSIGGYHGAKIRRYQDLITFHISQNNERVLNMLNTKYIIIPKQGEGPMAQLNPGALGNAWFVDQYRFVNDPNEEILALGDFNPANEAIIDKRFEDFVREVNPGDSSSSQIGLTSYEPNHLVYESSANSEKLAVFSEVYYEKGWNAFIDGEPAPYFRVNYILRAIMVPPGEHTIEFKFHPKTYFMGQKISLVSSIILLLMLAGLIFMEVKKFAINEDSLPDAE